MMRQDAKSLALFRAIHAKLLMEGDQSPYLRVALTWAAKFSKERPEDIWLAEWVNLLGAALQTYAGLDALHTLMLSNDQHAIDMRSSSPFPGVLTVKERTRVLREFEEQWRDGRAA
ncbi:MULTISPECIES: hypothetical protein [Acidithiobacillus]|jgi:hypothetical protein|uniref:hypothetical protein n=1 Tax=Acidithiobacillus TaxID=119977 RepID=UPI001C07266D|nr:hypothetical protein [Acidithiobacillus ferrooxidans]MBU2806945.1 hypothetical protein [Acidithiobacillus ferrooxidans F221]